MDNKYILSLLTVSSLYMKYYYGMYIYKRIPIIVCSTMETDENLPLFDQIMFKVIYFVWLKGEYLYLKQIYYRQTDICFIQSIFIDKNKSNLLWFEGKEVEYL